MTAPEPCYVPGERERSDLELLSSGALAPRTRLEGKDGLVSLRVPAAVAEDALAKGCLLIQDPEGASQARVLVDGLYEAEDGLVGVAGAIERLPYDGYAPFRRFRMTPEGLRQKLGHDYLTVPVIEPLTADDVDAIGAAASGRPVVLLTLYGSWTDGLPAAALVRATLRAATTIAESSVVVVPVAPRGQPVRDDALVATVIGNYAAADVHWPSGTGSLPSDVEAVVTAARPAHGTRGLVLFFTGLSGSGKSTIAREVRDALLEQHDREVTSLDGDVVRRNLSAGLGFSLEDRARNVTRIGWVAAELARHGAAVIASPIAPLESVRQQVRAMTRDAGASFVLVHVATPVEECERRDRKGLYAKARAGEIPDFTGISSPYETPESPEIRIDTTDLTIEEAADRVLGYLSDHGLVQTHPQLIGATT